MPQSSAEKLENGIKYSSNQADTSNVNDSGVAAPVATRAIKRTFDKPPKAMKIKELFETYFLEN